MKIDIIAAFSLLPEESKTYKRIVSIPYRDFSARSGDIREQQMEQDLVKQKLKKMGPTAVWTETGCGVYDINFTWSGYLEYGHTHYRWGWSNLRFGKTSYLHLTLLTPALLYSASHSSRLKNAEVAFFALLCAIILVYLCTSVNSIWLLSGLPCLHLQNNQIEQ